MQPRSRQRIAVEIPVIVTTVLDSLEGTIIDLSEGGAQIAGCGLPARSQCQIDYEGHVVFATVQWTEEDRMGIRFPYELTDGPLFDRLEIARAARLTPTAFQPRIPGMRPAGGFGRRFG
ncbi:MULTISPECIES: PilZ domain-containing protein [Sphingobium]|uniref:Pilus assembly protein PilZ n=1 Tax=Sphingobium chungbukense TaxID=56193 RepID=A0A0M3AV08_9SPHN|nr:MULTISPECIES: PilZ domain-containing protein [Sphingobium]KKW92399.1 pilus assembly protein PilZ [Sphingobium chungbukense]PJG48738.1 PilZ domain-containing protein [Sphingobium sp. LB126]